jgi:cytochrome c-type biogenesis protein
MLAAAISADLAAWWAPALAFVAGLISFASPCVFPLVPGYVAFVSGERGSSRRPAVPILLFIGGFSLIFILLGAFSGVFVKVLQSTLGLRIAGGVIAVFGLLMILYALRLGAPSLYAEHRPFMSWAKPGAKGAFPLGMAFAIGWTPCIGPVLGAILSMSALQGGSARGAMLLAAYSIGLGLPLLLVGLGVDRLMSRLSWIQRRYHLILGLAGGLMLSIGVLMASGLWTRLLSPLLNRITTFRTVL